MLDALLPYRDSLAGVVVESTYNWYWLVDGLQAAHYPVHLANPAAIKQYEGLKHGSDISDAVHLAHLLRLGILPTAYVYPVRERALRDLCRKRQQLVRYRTQQVLSVENILARHTGCRLHSNQIKRLTDEAVLGLALPLHVTEAIGANIAVIRTLQGQIHQLEASLRQALAHSEQRALLMSAPGIGEVLATTIALEMGTIERFEAVGNFASYARCVNSRRVSNGKNKGVGNVRNGNKYLAWAFVEASHFARRYCPQAQRFYDRKKARTNAIVATKALAHKLARACYHMLKEGQRFDVARCFG
jgi:transposase